MKALQRRYFFDFQSFIEHDFPMKVVDFMLKDLFTQYSPKQPTISLFHSLSVSVPVQNSYFPVSAYQAMDVWYT